MKKRFAAAAGSGSGFRRSLGALALMLTCGVFAAFSALPSPALAGPPPGMHHPGPGFGGPGHRPGFRPASAPAEIPSRLAPSSLVPQLGFLGADDYGRHDPRRRALSLLDAALC